MRVTQMELYRNFQSNLGDMNAALADVNHRFSSGKKLNALSDSPAGSADLVHITDLARKIEMYRSNISVSSYYLKAADGALNEAHNTATSIYSLGTQACSQIISPEARAALAAEVRSLREQLVSLANTQQSGRFIFAGSNSQTPPFVLNGNDVSYQGNTDINEVPVGEGVDIRQGVSGSSAFTAVFQSIGDLLSSMEANDLSGMKSAVEQFHTSLDDLGLARGEIGVNLKALENMSSILNSGELLLKERRSGIEDADMVEATMQLSQLKTALDAALSAGGSILNQSNLFDIIG